jgi:hypothetical protein
MATTGHESELVTIAGLKGALQQYKTSVSDTKMNASLKGAANGVAELDSNGKVPAAQLPSFVDDIIEGYLYNGKFYKEAAHTTEITGEGGKIYTDLSTNKTYRWSGSAYTQIKGDLVIGTSAGTAADGKVVADHVADTTVHISAAERTSWNAKGSYSKPSGGIPKTDLASGVQTSLGLADTALQEHQDISGKADKSSTVSNVAYDTTNKKITKTINGTTSDVVKVSTIKTDLNLSKSDVGLGNVGNFKAVSTVASQGLSSTEQSNARANIGAGVGTITGIKMNGSSKGSSGVVDLGTVITSHQDISGKADVATTLAGYGITDAKIESGVITLGSSTITPLTSHQDISGKQNKVEKLGSTTKPVYTSAGGTFAVCSTYAGGTAVTLNGTSKAANTASFYAPTAAGTSGQYLVSSGSGAPTWASVASVQTCKDIIGELS